MSEELIETWISTGGRYSILVLAKSNKHIFKIVTNNRNKSHVDAPKVYESLQEAMNRVEVLEAEN